MGDMQEQMLDTEWKEQRLHDIANRLYFALLDGYLTGDEFKDTLIQFGILTEWNERKHNADNA